MAETRLPQDILLSPDERYDVWEIKRVERPYLMELENEQEDKVVKNGEEVEDESESSIENSFPLPLVDGCDLKGWRHSKLVQISSCAQGALNVGTGCSLMRRESQLPVVSSNSLGRWKTLQAKLLEQPKSTARRILERDALDLLYYPWFEKENLPVILEGLTKDWKATETCTFDRLVEEFGDYDWRFSDTHGATMSLNTYKKYVSSLEGQCDDAPLAVYDSQLHVDERASLLDDYKVPKCFDAPDLFQSMIAGDGEDSDEGDENDDDDKPEMPPYRWILIGPPRSGTGLHIDPLGTHAWVTLIEGAKRWVLFPYGTDKTTIGMQDPQIPSAIWFSSEWYQKSIELNPGAIEILQYPGETVYVPAGWPHLVLNLEFSTAITHNYATEYPSFSRILLATEEEEPEMSVQWKKYLHRERPEIWAQHAKDTESNLTLVA
mmetsp:Transcript_1501/g.3314  ORF Transcript_1501/g.3314 Transcript_1501/m.3314 type:complete len:435 (-) Transcript_1501:69-1373(-)|eukprot:CAMPEP_0168300918 /NCGR_PEP_ID=MMETSP0142_2-20121227/32809_1 /TAXON_ID=44445 /ORGANISM="Pseudo-nitzschia australis, Strain 10249 10 AB" /LENGTH=434 /DNA_ID=CAMNT_0008251037 /DNA_START=5 /DNA_END=1309 /DNA_ORIENTATION=+